MGRSLVLAAPALAAVALVVVVLRDGMDDAGSARTAPLRPASALRVEATRACASRVESGGRRPAPVRARRGDIATPSVILHGLRLALAFDPDAARPLGGDAVYKAPVSVRAGARVILELAPRGRARLALDFDPAEWAREGRRVSRGAGQRAVAFEPCSPDEPRFSGPGEVGPWTQWNGGLLIGRPGCATLRVRREGRPVERVALAVGVPARRCR